MDIYSTDINECQQDLAECDEQAACYNTDGSYLCVCNKGLYGDGFYCLGRFFFLLNYSVLTHSVMFEYNSNYALSLSGPVKR